LIVTAGQLVVKKRDQESADIQRTSANLKVVR